MKWDNTWDLEAVATALGVLLATAIAILNLKVLRNQTEISARLVKLEQARRSDEERQAWLRNEPVLLVDEPRAELVSPGKHKWSVRVRNIGGDAAKVHLNLDFLPPGASARISCGTQPDHVQAMGETTFDVTDAIETMELSNASHNQRLAEADRRHWSVWGRVVAQAQGRVVSAAIGGDARTGVWVRAGWELFKSPEGRDGVRPVPSPRWNILDEAPVRPAFTFRQRVARRIAGSLPSGGGQSSS